MEERLQKIIAASGLMSRRTAEEAILKGKVTVNGRIAVLGEKADRDADLIRVYGKRLPAAEQFVYVLLNKPAGYVTTLSDEKGRKNVSELVSSVGKRLYPVGRLDLNSDGLLIMTNDGDLANRMMHPSGEVEKLYQLSVMNQSDDFEEALEKLTEPIEINGRLTSPAKIRIIEKDYDTAVLAVTIHEGRNRQIRRLCENAGLKVIRLTRIAEGPIRLGNLPSGKFRYLTEEEISVLKAVGENHAENGNENL